MDKSELDALVDLGEKELARLEQEGIDRDHKREAEYQLKIKLFLDTVKKVVPAALHEYVEFGDFERQDTLTRHNATAKIVVPGFAPIVLLCYFNDYNNGDLALRGVDLLSYHVGNDPEMDYGSMYYVYEHNTHVLMTIPPKPDFTFFCTVLALAKQKGDNKAQVEQEVAQKNQEDKHRVVGVQEQKVNYATLPVAAAPADRLISALHDLIGEMIDKAEFGDK